jgi:Fe-S cluster biogenesis protein NfuA
MIPIHPVAGPDERTVRWNVPAGLLRARGAVRSVPEPLAALLRDGTVGRVLAGEGHLDVALASERTWRVEGARVRTALLAALEAPEGWVGADEPAGDESAGDGPAGGVPAGDDRLAAAARAALEGEVGELARSHGGAIELDSVRDGVVTVRMRGACHGCPAAGLTLHARLEKVLRQQCPELEEVRSAPSRRPVWASLRLGPRDDSAPADPAE